jgi:tetratricopeptide (TPR) repeat protein
MPTLREAQRRHAAHYAELLASMKAEYREVADRENVVERFEREWDQLETGQAWAAGATQPDSGDADLAFLFSVSADPLVGLRHRPEVVRRWTEPSLWHDAAARDPGVMAENINRIGHTYYNAGEFEEARDAWRWALAKHREIDPSSDLYYFGTQEAGYEANLAAAEERLGNRGAARSAYEHARDAFHRIGERQQEGRMLMNLGTLHAEEDAHDEALALYREAIEIAQETSDPEGQELGLGAMGNSLGALGRFDEARIAVEAALELARALGDRATEALRLGNLGNVLLKQGDLDAALSVRSDALALAKAMGDPRTEALQLNGIGEIYAMHGEDNRGVSYFAEAERLFSTIGMNEAAERAHKGRVAAAKRDALRTTIDQYNGHIDQGNAAEAIATLDRWTALGYDATPYQRSVLLGLYGFAEHVAGRLERATARLVQALEIDRELPPGELQARHLGNLGDVYRQLGDGEHAATVYAAAASTAGLSDDLRQRLAQGLELCHELGTEHRGGGLGEAAARDFAIELANCAAGGESVDVQVTYADGSIITGRSALLEPSLSM